MVKRELYLKRIRPFYESDLIKVITGIRRCGKSILLNQIMNEMKEDQGVTAPASDNPGRFPTAV